MTISKYPTPAAAGAEVHNRAEQHVSSHGCTYREAVNVVLASDKELAEAYARPSTQAAVVKTAEPSPVPLAEGKPPGERVHARAMAFLKMAPGLSYQTAVRKVLDLDPDLKAAYEGVAR